MIGWEGKGEGKGSSKSCPIFGGWPKMGMDRPDCSGRLMRQGGKRGGIEISLEGRLTVRCFLELLGCCVESIHIGVRVDE